MSKVLKKLELLSGAMYGVIFVDEKPVASTFPKEKAIYAKLAQQAFGHIFRQGEKLNPRFNEAHLQLSQHYMICLKLDRNAFYVAALPKNGNVHRAQKVSRGAVGVLNKVINKTSKKT